MKPSTAQQSALVLAVSEGYIRPGSATHGRRCNLSTGRLLATVKACQRNGWLRPISDGRYVITDAGLKFVPSRPVRQDWAF